MFSVNSFLRYNGFYFIVLPPTAACSSRHDVMVSMFQLKLQTTGLDFGGSRIHRMTHNERMWLSDRSV